MNPSPFKLMDDTIIFLIPQDLIEHNPDPWHLDGKVKDCFATWLNDNIPKHRLKAITHLITLEMMADDLEARALLKLTWNIY